MELYLFFHEVFYGGDSDMLYKFQLPSLPISEIKPEEATELVSPVLKFPKDKYPYGMGCVHFNSKLYFFGGLMRNPCKITFRESIGHDFTNQVYSRGVYVLDLTDNDQVLKEGPSMTTGKPNTFAFVADGMIYVLGGTVRQSLGFSDNLIKRFERFNPVDMTWKVLDDTPLRDLFCIRTASVLENQHKVLLTVIIDRDCVFLIYDFLHDRWEPEHLLLSSFPNLGVISDIREIGGANYLYGIRFAAPHLLPVKLGPLKELEIDQMRKLSFVDASLHDGPEDWNDADFFPRVARCTHSRMMYLGDGHFCSLTTGQHEASDFGDYFSGPVPEFRKVSLTIFKDIANPVGHQLEGISFEAKILCNKSYEMKKNNHGGVYIGAHFIVGACNYS